MCCRKEKLDALQRLLDVDVAVRRRPRARALRSGRTLGRSRALGGGRFLGLARRLERLVLEPLLLALELLCRPILGAVAVLKEVVEFGMPS